MKDFIEKLIGRLEDITVKHNCKACLYTTECDKVQEEINEYTDLCGATIKEVAINTVKKFAEEYINTLTDTSTTNADRIRSMTDEELAEFLLKVNTAYAEPCMIGEKDCKWEDYPTHDKGCKDCFLDWLQSEVEGVTENE